MEQEKQNPLQILDAQFVDRKSEFQSVLPNGCTFEKFSRIVKTAMIQTPDLLTADRASLFMACFKAAQDGLLPDGRESALVIYNTKQKDNSYKKMVQYMPMIAGILKKVRNSGELLSVSAHAVYENDEFDYCLGDEEHISHKPTVDARGKVRCVYAIVKTKEGAIYRAVMSYDDVEKIRRCSKVPDSGAWTNHWDEMAKKTVLRRLSKLLPMSTDIEQVIQRDDDMFDFDNKKNQLTDKQDIININSTLTNDQIRLQQVQTKVNDADHICDGVPPL